jgi:uncharacterized damage-inducible protein DinB
MKNILHRLDTIHDRLLTTVTPLEVEIYQRRAAEDEWSVAEIVHHLCLVEERVIKDLDRALQQEPRQPALLRRLIPTSIVASRVLRVKSPKAVVPTSPPEKGVAIDEYNNARDRLKDLCARSGEQRLRSTTFKHPFLGEISGVATVSFVGYHEKRHYKQICEVLRKLGR